MAFFFLKFYYSFKIISFVEVPVLEAYIVSQFNTTSRRPKRFRTHYYERETIQSCGKFYNALLVLENNYSQQKFIEVMI